MSTETLPNIVFLQGFTGTVEAAATLWDAVYLCCDRPDWVHRYNNEGLPGLSNRGGQGRKPLLDDDQKARLADLVRKGPDPEKDGVVRWRRVDLKRRIEQEFDVMMHERTVGAQLAELGFRRLSVRPQHPNADEEAQEAFKKTSPPK